MADLIIGEPTPFTTMSAGVLNAQRITFAPWELDWEFFNAINPIVHFIANTTTGQAFPVVGKGGAEHLGYWFDVDTPAGTWASGQRCTPQRQLAIQQFASFFLASLAMANDDVYLVWYQNVAQRRTWAERILWVDEGGAARGMLSRQQIEIIPPADDQECIFAGGNLNVMGTAVTISNLSLAATGEYGVRYSPLAMQPQGPGLIVLRCKIRAATSGVYIERCDGLTSVIGNCVFTGCMAGVDITINAEQVIVAYNTAYGCNVGYNLGNARVLARDLIGAECVVCFQGFGAVGCQYCADTDGTLPVHATNWRNQDSRANLRFFHDLARPGDKAFDHDFRTHYDSIVRAAGVSMAYAPLAWDADGMLRPNGVLPPGPPSIGAFEPRETCYAPAAEMTRAATHRKGPTP
jgi:hypothetical protein